MKVLVACEYSGVVRDAFRRRGHDAWSCDIILDDEPHSEYHLIGDVLGILDKGWDLMIAHPPCTHLAVSGARWFKDKVYEQLAALQFVRRLLEAPIPRIAVENPVGVISTAIRKPDQIVQPWMFGDEATKTTCLWLKGLPPSQDELYLHGITYHLARNVGSLGPEHSPDLQRQWLNSGVL